MHKTTEHANAPHLNDPWMRMNIYARRHHPAFAPLRGDPPFEALLNDPRNNAPLF